LGALPPNPWQGHNAPAPRYWGFAIPPRGFVLISNRREGKAPRSLGAGRRLRGLDAEGNPRAARRPCPRKSNPHTSKTTRTGLVVLLELMTRFELVTSSLPIQF